MNADDIARYLRTHPQFFDQHPELLESIQVPHPYGGRAIPLAERQTVALREKLKVLEGRLAELLQFGEENDAISEKVHRLSVALVPLGQTAVFGLLALGSEDAKRFYPEMGTLYLRRIGELCAAGVTARL
jgi:uncharacterized protein YigA (DUF484 family)